MTVNVYTKEDKVKYIELDIDVCEYLLIQRALCDYAGAMDRPIEERLLAVAMTDSMKDKTQIELEEFN